MYVVRNKNIGKFLKKFGSSLLRFEDKIIMQIKGYNVPPDDVKKEMERLMFSAKVTEAKIYLSVSGAKNSFGCYKKNTDGKVEKCSFEETHPNLEIIPVKDILI